MYRTLLAFVILTSTSAAPAPDDDAQAKILTFVNTNDGKGNYEFSYETSNGLSRQESGRLVNAGQPDEHLAVIGSYSYLDSTGEEQLVQYIADENGYRIISEPQEQLPPPQVEISMRQYGSALSPNVVATLLG